MNRFGWMLLALLALGTAGCGGKVAGEPAAGAVAEEEIVIPVQAEHPNRETIAAYFETNARIVAENRVEVMTKGTGLVLTVNAEEGDEVQQGQILAALERDELEAQVKQARVNVQQNKYQMEKAVEQQKKGILSEVEAQNARFAYEAAVASLEVQEMQLDNQLVVAPISGVVTARNITEGQMISAGTPAFSIVDPSSYILPISPPENQLPNLSMGQVAKVRIDSVNDQVFDALIRRINPNVDPVSGTVKVVLDFSDEARPFLREGSFARVSLVMETRENVLAVPKDAVIEENARKYLMVVEHPQAPDGVVQQPETAEAAAPAYVAKRVEIRTGLEDSNMVEVLEGIDDESLVVTLGQQTLRAGQAVSLTDPDKAFEEAGGTTAEQALQRSRVRRNLHEL